jgi:carboxyl-terminal processing protease
MTTGAGRPRYATALALLLGLSIGSAAAIPTSPPANPFGFTSTAKAQSYSRAGKPDPLAAKLELMQRTMRIARDLHVERPGRPELVAGAVQGLLARIDPEAEVYSRADLRRIARFATTNRTTIGLEVRREPPPRRQVSRGYRVISSKDGSPSALAGLKAGDLITHIDGQPIGERSHFDVLHLLLSGTPGRSVHLTIEPAGDEPSTDVILENSPIATSSGDGRAGPAATGMAGTQTGQTVSLAAPGIAYIRLASVDAPHAGEIERSLAEFGRVHPGTLRGIVIDLRSTADGTIGGAHAIADAFLDGGIDAGAIVAVSSRDPDHKVHLAATAGDVAAGRPMAVLVDSGTAGAAEALTAALQESLRARVVGMPTAGRGAVRTLVPLGARGAKGMLRITTGRLTTPSGRSLDGDGITPDVAQDQTPASMVCRSLDIMDSQSTAGRCRRRTFAEDGQLAKAVAILDEAVVAAKGAIGATRP